MNTKGKRLLILGAGRGQIGLYKAAHEMGVTTIAGTLPDSNPPCISLADEICYMNILDPDEVERKASKFFFDGVATCCLDKGLKALGRLCDKYSIPGYTENAAELCNNKLKMKIRLIEQGVNTAPFKRISREDDVCSAVEYLGGYPIIIKATDLAGSKGIYKASNKEEAICGFRKAKQETKKEFLLIEKFLEGKEFGCQAFIYNGNVLFVMPHGDLLYNAATAVPIGHYVPYECSDELLSKITVESKKAIIALGLNDCAVNIDFIEVNGNVYILELSGRAGANCLPELVSINYGINYYKMIVSAALGIDPQDIWNERNKGKAGLAKMIISQDKSGILKSIQYNGRKEPYIFDINLFAKPGSEVYKFRNSNHCLAQVVVQGDNLQECYDRADKVISDISIEIQ